MNNLTEFNKKDFMSSDCIASLLNKQEGNVRRTMKSLEEKGIIKLTQFEKLGEINGLGFNSKKIVYHVTERDSYVVVAQLSPEFTAFLVDEWQKRKQQTLPKWLTDLSPEAQIAISDLSKQRDEAIATKAEIGCKREATAMNTASQAVKKVNKLEIELDKSREYCTVKRMQMICHGQKFNWRELKSASIDLNLATIDVFDANYGSVKAYHKSVWLEAYAINLNDLC